MSGARKTFIITISVLVLLLVGLVVADIASRSAAQKSAREALASIQGVEVQEPVVKAKGEPFITQVLAGKLKNVYAQAGSASFVVDGAPVQLLNVDVQVQGLTTSLPYVADSMEAKALITAESLQNVVNAKGLKMQLTHKDGYIDLETSVAGLPVVVSMLAEPAMQNASDLSRVVPAIKFTPAKVSVDVQGIKLDAPLDQQTKVLDQQKQLGQGDTSQPGAQKDAAQGLQGAQGTQGAQKNDVQQGTQKEGQKDAQKDKKDQKQGTKEAKRDTSSFDLGNLLGKFQLPSFYLPLDQAPEGLQITGLTITEEGVVISLSGAQLNLSALAK